MFLYQTSRGPVVVQSGQAYAVDADWDDLFNDDSLTNRLTEVIEASSPDPSLVVATESPLAPLAGQEVWAAGVTYYRSRTARMEESESAGGGDFYDRVYTAERPELFLKATPHRTVGPGQAMHLRTDSKWIVPEPELTVAVTRNGKIIGYTVGNDLSCRDLEAENPLYLPQAKTFDRCAALGPGLLVSSEPMPQETTIRLTILRDGTAVVDERTTVASLKRSVDQLVDYLFCENSHPQGCFLMTGTGIVPPDEFSLRSGDVVEIEIEGIGCLSNIME